MIRRLFIYGVPLFFALLVWTQAVEAQCSPNPCYTANPPSVTRLTPAQAAKQGISTVTVNVSAMDGSNPSHNISIGTAVTRMLVNYKSNNTSSVSFYNWWDNNTPTFWFTPSGINGSFEYDSYSGWPTGHVLNIQVRDNAGTTQDVIHIATTSQAPGIYNSDNLPENTILHFHASGGGGSMLNDFTECQAGQIHQCINATHTPFTTLTVKNTTSGETQFHSKHVSGNTASANQTLNFSDDMFFSALPEDVFEYTEGDEVDCSVYGPIGVGPLHMDIRFERAITESYISSILNSNGMHPEHIYCIIAATPPDFPGPDEALPGTPSGQVVNIAFLYREWPVGTQEAGTPWNLVFPDIQEVGIGYYVKTTMEPDPSGCTMWDNGFRHLPLPTPLDPQPQ